MKIKISAFDTSSTSDNHYSLTDQLVYLPIASPPHLFCYGYLLDCFLSATTNPSLLSIGDRVLAPSGNPDQNCVWFCYVISSFPPLIISWEISSLKCSLKAQLLCFQCNMILSLQESQLPSPHSLTERTSMRADTKLASALSLKLKHLVQRMKEDLAAHRLYIGWK